MSDNYPSYEQHFEVVLLRNGVGESEATQDDLRRVATTAKDQIAAMTSDEVLAAAGQEFRPIIATPPGVPTGIETMARRRALDTEGHKNTTDW